MAKLILVANPGSSSRRYAIYEGETCRGRLHFETNADQIICTAEIGSKRTKIPADLAALSEAVSLLPGLLKSQKLLADTEEIAAIALRVAAPSTYFTKDRRLDSQAVSQLKELKDRAPLHVSASLSELAALDSTFPGVTVLAISDSAFHQTRPEVAKHFGLPWAEADKYDLKRFGYHGLSVASVVAALSSSGQLPERLVVCHLGSGSSVTAVLNGESVDNTMGYSPLEGVMMATRSGNLDPTAAEVLRTNLGLDASQLEDYLNSKSGLLGVSGSSAEIPTLLDLEKTDPRVGLALDLYVYRIQQAIGQMAAVLQGLDGLVFTATVGERSAVIRQRIAAGLMWLGLSLDPGLNDSATQSTGITSICRSNDPKPILIVPSQEELESVKRTLQLVEGS